MCISIQYIEFKSHNDNGKSKCERNRKRVRTLKQNYIKKYFFWARTSRYYNTRHCQLKKKKCFSKNCCYSHVLSWTEYIAWICILFAFFIFLIQICVFHRIDNKKTEKYWSKKLTNAMEEQRQKKSTRIWNARNIIL